MQFGGGAPWVTLDLDDTDTVAVMAIQKADGTISRAEAGRLSALVQVHGERRSPTGPDPADSALALDGTCRAAAPVREGCAGAGAPEWECGRARRCAGG